MGEYTAGQKFYKPAASDLVTVETDIKYNWERLDDRTKPLVEWEPSDQTTLTGNVPLEQNFKYYKRSSGSKWASNFNGTVQAVAQDTNAYVPEWSLITLEPGWATASPSRVMACQTFSVEDMVHWRGLASFTVGELPIKTNTLVATNVPSQFRPLGSDREFQVCSGDTQTGNNVATIMLRFTTAGEIRMFKYGVGAQLVGDRHITFNGISYCRAA